MLLVSFVHARCGWASCPSSRASNTLGLVPRSVCRCFFNLFSFVFIPFVSIRVNSWFQTVLFPSFPLCLCASVATLSNFSIRTYSYSFVVSTGTINCGVFYNVYPDIRVYLYDTPYGMYYKMISCDIMTLLRVIYHSGCSIFNSVQMAQSDN